MPSQPKKRTITVTATAEMREHYDFGLYEEGDGKLTVDKQIWQRYVEIRRMYESMQKQLIAEYKRQKKGQSPSDMTEEYEE